MPAAPSAPRGAARTTRRPQRVPVFRNDNWPPRPPPPALPVPSFLATPDPHPLLRALPTPSFVAPPDAHKPPAVPSKAVIAASAVPLADWVADVVWALYVGPPPSAATAGTNSGLAGADKAPQPLAAFVHAVLSQTLASPQCAALGLYYLVRLPVRLGSAGPVRTVPPLWHVSLDPDGHTCYSTDHDRGHDRAARAAFVAELYASGADDVPYRLAALALMLGNKWLDDHTFTNKTWHQVTHQSLPRLTALEQRALECFNHSLNVPNDDWRAWLGVLKEGAQGALATISATGFVGVPGATSALAIDAMERLEKELQVLTAGVGSGLVDVLALGKGVIGDRRQPQVPAPAPGPAPVEVDMDELEMEQVEFELDLDDGGPVPEELHRPVKVRLGPNGHVETKPEANWGAKSGDTVREEMDEWQCALRDAGGESWLMEILEDGEDQYAQDRLARDGYHLPQHNNYCLAPGAEWDRARDPPMLTRARGELDPVQRPARVGKKTDAFAVGSELKAKNAHVPRVELYDARLPVRGYPGYLKPHDAVGKGAYEYPTKGVYYPAYETLPRDLKGYGAYAPGRDAGYDYYASSYVPRHVPTWAPQGRAGVC